MAHRRGATIWDAFSHFPSKIRDGSSGDVAVDSYGRWREDLRLLARIGLPYYRFSIGWSRILPAGSGAVNEEGVRFYSEMIDEMLRLGIRPVVTLYHWDLPLPLALERDGWLSPRTASAFAAYAAVCFERFGERVRHWITIHGPGHHAINGWARGEHAPGRSVDPTREPYVAAHHMLLAHALAAARYRRLNERLPRERRGLLSIGLNADWREPLTGSAADAAAAQRSMEFTLGWLADPLYFGDYPRSMRVRLGETLPRFTEAQAELLRNSSDFFALQHYSSLMVSQPNATFPPLPESSFHAAEGVRWHNTRGARKNVLGWDVAPFGMYKLARWVHERYAPRGGIVVTENGFPTRDESGGGAADDKPTHDLGRVCYIKQYLQALHRAMREGVNVRGYFVWSLLDSWEWTLGHTARFGLVRVEPGSLARVPKASASWYARVVRDGGFNATDGECNATLPAAPQFRTEGAELQAIVNSTAGTTPPLELARAMLVRTSRLAALAERQAQHEAERGDFGAARLWDAKAAKLLSGAERQARQLRQRVERMRAAAGGAVESAAAAGSTAAEQPAQEGDRVAPPPAGTSAAEGTRVPQVLSASLLREAMVSPFGMSEEDEADYLARATARVPT
eukprot:scaffold268974_cov27-Tisochrysis_lutea.AAC.1